MTPTKELRFVEREIEIEQKPEPFLIAIDNTGKPIPRGNYKTTVRVLQQKWIDKDTYGSPARGFTDYEWRDVPMVKEDV